MGGESYALGQYPEWNGMERNGMEWPSSSVRRGVRHLWDRGSERGDTLECASWAEFVHIASHVCYLYLVTRVACTRLAFNA